MLKKFIILIGLFLSLSIFIIGCSNQSSNLSLEKSIKEIITPKDSEYDFLNDKEYMDYMSNLGYQLITNKTSKPLQYSIGNMDEDNIPELVVFKERDSNNIDDEGSLELYQFNGDEYALLDSISMNFDNTNYQIEIGKIADNQNGLFLNNQVGAHSGMTYGFILKDKKLKSILDDNKISLISVYPENEIKDINGDGILDFSIYAIDPETVETSMVDSDKMTLWYTWNEKDSGELVMVHRKDYTNETSNANLFEEAKDIMDNNFSDSLQFILDNKDYLSKFDTSELLMDYIKTLDEISYDRSVNVDKLFIKYQDGQNFNHLFDKYGLTMEKLNNPEYLKRDKVLKDEEELKQDIITHINLGYKLASSEGMYYYLNNYQLFLDLFGENISNEYRDYLNILALDTNKPSMIDGGLVISLEDLFERILLVDSFKMVYPYSNLLPKVNSIYMEYIHVFFYGDNHNPTFNTDTFLMKDEILKEYEKFIEKYQYTNFADIVKSFMDWLKENNNLMDDTVREKLNERLN